MWTMCAPVEVNVDIWTLASVIRTNGLATGVSTLIALIFHQTVPTYVHPMVIAPVLTFVIFSSLLYDLSTGPEGQII